MKSIFDQQGGGRILQLSKIIQEELSKFIPDQQGGGRIIEFTKILHEGLSKIILK